jgi:hypothetical protein
MPTDGISLRPKKDFGTSRRALCYRAEEHDRLWQILLQKSAISTAKRLTRFFEAHVAGCSIGSQL